MEVKILKTFVSAHGSFNEGDVVQFEHDDYTLQNWVENGLIEEVKAKKVSKKVVDSVENK